jgi:hypothetical protein
MVKELLGTLKFDDLPPNRYAWEKATDIKCPKIYNYINKFVHLKIKIQTIL